MKTAQTHLTIEFKAKAPLFKQLFLIQIELGKHTDEGVYYHTEVKELIEHGSIDGVIDGESDLDLKWR